MADRVLRGMSIGANSLESEKGVVFVDRKNVRYDCICGDEFTKALAVESEPPATWECAKCGEQAILVGTEEPEDEPTTKPVRTHWDMLCERRTQEELEVLLNEQLKLLRSGKLRADTRYRN
ncbi:RNA polymerase-binding protein RbpA [Boudabousia marimammalium]|uniref:RNA polymerase-binding protein RbpA n=1 Tax=Boudabousia marimammalium TaxID=156892 RepID=A0A1Q5PRF0_9ACTO|nr:RNA polymerase-binding protein RbpA [Boudabousia marimammalium]OKL49990.1 electron transporter [Boudabousia marimammalium]